MTEKTPTLVTFLLDRSGSMGSIYDATIEGFNAYLKTLQEGGKTIKFTRLQFDYNINFSIEKDCVAEPVANVKPLDKHSYQPRGGTPLIEAAIKTIEAVETSLEKFDTTHQVIVCIQTDGQENQSGPEYTWSRLKEMVEKKIKEGWVFNFMGTGIDAYAQGAAMGIPTANTMSTGTSREHVTSSYKSMGASNMRFANSGLTMDAGYTAAERKASGEDTIVPNAPLNLTPGPSPKKRSSHKLDLTP